MAPPRERSLKIAFKKGGERERRWGREKSVLNMITITINDLPSSESIFTWECSYPSEKCIRKAGSDDRRAREKVASDRDLKSRAFSTVCGEKKKRFIQLAPAPSETEGERRNAKGFRGPGSRRSTKNKD